MAFEEMEWCVSMLTLEPFAVVIGKELPQRLVPGVALIRGW